MSGGSTNTQEDWKSFTRVVGVQLSILGRCAMGHWPSSNQSSFLWLSHKGQDIFFISNICIGFRLFFFFFGLILRVSRRVILRWSRLFMIMGGRLWFKIVMVL